MLYKFTGKVYPRDGVCKVGFQLWEEKGWFFNKRVVDKGEIQLYEIDLPGYYDKCLKGAGGRYDPDPEDADEFQLAMIAVKTHHI